MMAAAVLLCGLHCNYTKAQDPDFHIYICIGQSNMEGQASLAASDTKNISPRFLNLQAVTCGDWKAGVWRTAVPPLARCDTGLSPADGFGRTMVEYLPDSIRVGIVMVAVKGCSIKLYDPKQYSGWIAWQEDYLKTAAKQYGSSPYDKLIELCKKAQEEGVIKGILLHQGETDLGNNPTDAQVEEWYQDVQTVYNNIIRDLSLNAEEIPLIAGEVVHDNVGGICAGANKYIDQLPKHMDNAYVVSSSKCPCAGDNLHFDNEGYLMIGRRYAEKMLKIEGYIETPPEVKNEDRGGYNFWYEAEYLKTDTWGSKFSSTRQSGCSNKKVLKSPSDQFADAAPTEEGFITMLEFDAPTDSTYYIHARLNCPNQVNDYYWLRIDDGEFQKVDDLCTEGDFLWETMAGYELEAGRHTLYIAAGGAFSMMDKLCISNEIAVPLELGLESAPPAGIGFIYDRPESGEVYNLGGKRIQAPERGINIIDGRKILIE